MSYKLIRIDPVHRVFELRWVQESDDDEMTFEIADLRKPVFTQNINILNSKIKTIVADAILIDDDDHVDGESKVVRTCQEISSKFINKALVNFRVFSGSYKPFWVESRTNDGFKIIETNMIPETKSLKIFRKHYRQYVECYNDKEHMRWFINKCLKFGAYGEFQLRNDGCVYNRDGLLIYEFYQIGRAHV